MDKNSRIYVAGHGGLIGSALMNSLHLAGFNNVLCRSHQELDLTRQTDVEKFFSEERPEYVVLNAAIPANSVNKKTNPVGLMIDNILIIANTIDAARRFGTKKLIFACSIACYPHDSKLDDGRLSESSMQPGSIPVVEERYYSMPKLLGEELCRVCCQTSEMKCVTIVIPQAYGSFYHYENSDRLPVFPALIKRFTDAVKEKQEEVVVWGTGKLRRELTSVYDLADAYMILMQDDRAEGIYNVGSGIYISVQEMAEEIAKTVGYTGKIKYDANKPEAVEFPLLNSNRIRALGWEPKMSFTDGVKEACAYYREHFQ